MKPSPSKTTKAAGGKKRGREEAAGSAAGTSPLVPPPRPDPNREWKKSKAKTEDLLALLNSGFLREKEVDMWRVLTVYFSAPSMFITLWFGFDYGTNPPLGTLII
jgi:hypothetical protein